MLHLTSWLPFTTVPCRNCNKYSFYLAKNCHGNVAIVLTHRACKVSLLLFRLKEKKVVNRLNVNSFPAWVNKLQTLNNCASCRIGAPTLKSNVAVVTVLISSIFNNKKPLLVSEHVGLEPPAQLVSLNDDGTLMCLQGKIIYPLNLITPDFQSHATQNRGRSWRSGEPQSAKTNGCNCSTRSSLI